MPASTVTRGGGLVQRKSHAAAQGGAGPEYRAAFADACNVELHVRRARRTSSASGKRYNRRDKKDYESHWESKRQNKSGFGRATESGQNKSGYTGNFEP
jgi:hypothetical protein